MEFYYMLGCSERVRVMSKRTQILKRWTFIAYSLTCAACSLEKVETTTDASGATSTTGSHSTTDGEVTAEPTLATTGAVCEPAHLSSLAEHCAGIIDPLACDTEEILTDDQQDVIGRCHWATVYSVDPKCQKTGESSGCFYVAEGNGCTAPESCGDLKFGVYGQATCTDEVGLILSPPEGPYCLDPDGWSLCATADPPPQCLCPCQDGF